MLDKLDGRAPAMTPTTMPMENPAEAQASQAAPNGNGVDSHGINTENGNSPTNPIGSLQEYCVKCSLPMPIYDLGNTSGQPHQRNFEIVAKVGQIMTTGVGSSKKDAKREAAVTLLEKLKALGGSVAVQANGGSGSAHVGNDIDEETLKQVANMKIETLVRNLLYIFIESRRSKPVIQRKVYAMNLFELIDWINFLFRHRSIAKCSKISTRNFKIRAKASFLLFIAPRYKIPNWNMSNFWQSLAMSRCLTSPTLTLRRKRRLEKNNV